MVAETTAVATDSQRTLDVLVQVLGDAFSFDTLRELIELWRGKPLLIENDELPVAITGYCVALQDVDLICTRAGIDEILTVMTCLHEMSHLLLGHVPLLSYGPSTPAYQLFLRRRDLQGAARRDHFTRYALPQEFDAETLATLLLQCIMKETSSVPALARNLHG